MQLSVSATRQIVACAIWAAATYLAASWGADGIQGDERWIICVMYAVGGAVFDSQTFLRFILAWRSGKSTASDEADVGGPG